MSHLPTPVAIYYPTAMQGVNAALSEHESNVCEREHFCAVGKGILLAVSSPVRNSFYHSNKAAEEN